MIEGGAHIGAPGSGGSGLGGAGGAGTGAGAEVGVCAFDSGSVVRWHVNRGESIR